MAMSVRDSVEGPFDMVTYPSSVRPNTGLGAPSQAELPRWASRCWLLSVSSSLRQELYFPQPQN